MNLKFLNLLGLILILFIFSNCSNSATGVDQKLKARNVTLIAPKADSVQTTSPTFQWRVSAKVNSFHFKLSGSKDFSSAIISRTVDSTRLDVQGLPFDSTLYWKVGSITEGSDTVWSDVWNFRTITKPDSAKPKLPAPRLLTPKNNANNVPLKPDFKWKAVDDAEIYVIHMDMEGEGKLIKAQVKSNEFTPDNKLPDGTIIDWRVHAVSNGVDGKWSDIESFTTTKKPKSDPKGSGKLPAPRLLSPKDKATGVSLQPTFKWKTVEGADKYIIHVENDIREQVTNNEFTPANNLPENTSIQWRVRAVNNEVKGKWAETGSFTTKSATPAVNLVSPKDKAEVSATPVSLKWKTLHGINQYRVQVGLESHFGAPIVNKTVSKNSYQANDLGIGRTYYWRVQAVNDGNTKNWSTVRSFTIKVQDNNSNGSDRSALMALYRATNGDQWTSNSGWGSNDPLGTWYGINTNANGRVTRIDLWHNNLRGKIEEVPWGVLNKVKYLNIKYNHLTGQIPPQIGQMTSLEVLILQGRTYEIGGSLKQPEALGDGSWSEYYHQGKHYSNTNDFHGHIPATIGNLSNLIVLEISNAPHIVGPIPPEIGNLTNLKGLYLAMSDFRGTQIPKTLCNLTNLKHLFLGNSGLVGNIPPCFSNLTELTALVIPGGFEYGGTSFEEGLTGPLPDLSQFTELTDLVLYGNELTGKFPQYLNNGNFTQLNMLYLAGNNLTGTLPSNFNNLQNLYAFTVDRNNMTGSIESLTELPAKIKIIGIGWNDFSGDFPQSGWPDFYQLKTIRLNNNNITGSIPCSFWQKLDNSRLNLAWFNYNKLNPLCESGAKNMSGRGGDGVDRLHLFPQNTN